MIAASLEEVLDDAISARLQAVWTALPGRVLAFDAATSTVSVQPFPAIYQDGAAVEIPALQGVPVAYPAGGGCSVTFPLFAGDVVLLMFSSLPLARFRDNSTEGDPQEIRRFDLSDAWAIPIAAGKPVAATPGATVITPPTGGQVRLGSSTASQSAVLGELLLAYLDTHVHTTALGATSPPAVLTTGLLKSTIVKVAT